MYGRTAPHRRDPASPATERSERRCLTNRASYTLYSCSAASCCCSCVLSARMDDESPAQIAAGGRVGGAASMGDRPGQLRGCRAAPRRSASDPRKKTRETALHEARGFTSPCPYGTWPHTCVAANEKLLPFPCATALGPRSWAEIKAAHIRKGQQSRRGPGALSSPLPLSLSCHPFLAAPPLPAVFVAPSAGDEHPPGNSAPNTLLLNKPSIDLEWKPSSSGS